MVRAVKQQKREGVVGKLAALWGDGTRTLPDRLVRDRGEYLVVCERVRAHLVYTVWERATAASHFQVRTGLGGGDEVWGRLDARRCADDKTHALCHELIREVYDVTNTTRAAPYRGSLALPVAGA